MYFLYKKGIYGHGVFWIGEDLCEGKRQADEHASSDVDDYHTWELYFFKSQDDATCDAEHDLVYTSIKTTGEV